MDYKSTNDTDKRADGKSSDKATIIPHDGKAYKLKQLNFDLVIVVDDSTSMTLGRPISRWEESRKAISAIAEAALEFDSDGIDVHFLNSPTTKTCKTRRAVEELFNSVDLIAATPTGAKLEQLLGDYWEQLKQSRGGLFRSSTQPPKPVIFIVLTDGEPSDSPKDVILKYATKLEKARWPQHQVGIQFVQVGDSKEAARSLRALDDDLTQKCKRDIVDYTLYDPQAVLGSPEDEHTLQTKLTKILVGAIDKDVDERAAGDINAKQTGRAPPSYQHATKSSR